MRRFFHPFLSCALRFTVCEQLYEAQALLRNGTRDLPRMTKILQNERVSCYLFFLFEILPSNHSIDPFQVFLLVNEDTVKKYKSSLADEVEPAISELIQRAEEGLASLEKTQQLLETKVCLSSIRLPEKKKKFSEALF